MSFQTFKFVFAIVAFIFGTDAFADIVTVPNIPAGTQYRLVFVTSGARNALATNIADYNTFVTQQANQNPLLSALDTTWFAIGSTTAARAWNNTSTNPSSGSGVPIYRLDGIRIANSNSDLWDGALLSPIAINQNGVVVSAQVWTGTPFNGSSTSFALGSVLGSEAVYGRSNLANNGWTLENVANKNMQFAMYGISGVLTAVPEPSSMLFVGIGACMFSFARRR